MLPPDKKDPRTKSLIRTYKSYDLRILTFYPIVAAMLIVIVSGFAYQQLFKTDSYHEREKMQNQRRILTPGPRGNIYDREGRPLVVNRARYAITLNLDELRREFRREFLQVRTNYRELGDKDIPNSRQLGLIARYSVVQRYLDQVNAIINRQEKVDAPGLERHFNQQLLLPYTLLEDLTPEEYARLTEQVPVTSPLQLTATSVRFYPLGSLAAHTLGSVKAYDDLNVEGFPGDELTTFKMRGTTGRDGLEQRFNEHLQGKAGGTIYRVDPSGYRIEPPLERRMPVQGKNLTTSLDIDLQLAADEAMGERDNPKEPAFVGGVVAIDVQTGEVLVLLSRPDYNLNDFSPILTQATFNKIEEEGGWINRAVNGLYPPGSTFKVLTTIAGFHNGKLEPDTVFNCAGSLRVGNRSFACHNHHVHGDIDFHTALAKSCNVFFYREGLELGQPALTAEANRFGLNRPTGIELPETSGMNIPDPAWKRRRYNEPWTGGDTVTMAIGQSGIILSPLGMACFAASVARNETSTLPTLLHDPIRPRIRTEPIGLTGIQRQALVDSMRETSLTGTARTLTAPKGLNLRNLDIASKTGTAQKQTPKGMVNIAWFIAFAPAENPRIAVAVALEGDVPGEELGGGAVAAPIGGVIFKKYFEKHPEQIPLTPPS